MIFFVLFHILCFDYLLLWNEPELDQDVESTTRRFLRQSAASERSIWK